ncbi:MAG TPA: DUF1499 domain-containing protein [Candidatus Binataceae bacterium]|nr:DUF1499 domain-containing protein [Candidatus Binataceae bacterium]
MIPAWLSLLDAVLAVMFVAFGIAGAHFELIPPLFGFQLFVLGMLLAALGFFVGLIGILRTRDPAFRTGRRAALIGVLIGLAIVLPTATILVRSRDFPLLNDVTTDFADPPAFMHAGLLEENQNRNLGYDRARCEPLQKAAYRTIAPLATPASPAVAFQRVKVVAARMPDWRVIYVDPQRLALEGIAASGLFRFREDFVIEVRPGADGGSLIEMRSKSRGEISDFGANAAQIHAFFAMLARQLPAPKPA